MTTRPFPWKCGTCRERAVAPTTLATYTSELEHDGRKYKVTLNEFRVLQCERCQTVMLDDEASTKLSDALRAAAGLLMPAEIRKNREELGFTQKQLAGYLRIAESTLSRWETGAQIQQRSMDAFLRGFFQVPELRSFLGTPGWDWFAHLGESTLTSGYSWTGTWKSQVPSKVGGVQDITAHVEQGGHSRPASGMAA